MRVGMKQPNVLIIMTDEHRRDALGCYGHALVRTPALDRLAARGTRFTNAYTPSPICVPARAALATGRHVNENRCWSNAQPYRGQMPSWGHRLIEAGHRCLSIGKLHYRSGDDSNGFEEERFPLHVRGGVGWARGLLRKEEAVFGTADFAEAIGPGGDAYTDFDRRVCASAVDWLRGEGARSHDKPWALFVSFVRPHYPLTCPEEFYRLYAIERIDPPRPAGPGEAHPVIAAMRRFMNYDDYFDDETRLVARASYYGLCSFVDDLAGQVLAALEASGAADDTLVLYVSDHGELLGDHGMWTKCVMYEDSAAIPMILAGPGVPEGAVCGTPASLIDVFPTVIEAVGLAVHDEDADLPGRSLAGLASSPDEDRTILSEYHDGGSVTGMFMVRHGRWKYVHYPGFAPQLFDLANDRLEERDLGCSPDHAEIRDACLAAMKEIVDPEEANASAFADQAVRIAELGGREGILALEDYDFTPVE